MPATPSERYDINWLCGQNHDPSLRRAIARAFDHGYAMAEAAKPCADIEVSSRLEAAFAGCVIDRPRDGEWVIETTAGERFIVTSRRLDVPAPLADPDKE